MVTIMEETILRSRIFNIMQYEKNPKTGEDLHFNEDIIKVGLAHKTIKKWAYVCHDQDVLDDGTPKPRHWHIVVWTGTSALEVKTIAKWFNIEMQYVQVPKGRNAFIDCVEYLTHESPSAREEGKHLYSDKEIKANFDFREEINKKNERILKYGKNVNDDEYIQLQVLYNGMTLKEVRENHPLLYKDKIKVLQAYRLDYLKETPMPKIRINFYIEGKGGYGKGLMSKALARSIIDPENEMPDDAIFFEVGSDKTTFEGYDGQPVIIWNDCRAITLLQKLGGRENVFNVFDPFPPNIKQNIKYGSIKLTNQINIVNSVEEWKDFLDGLAGEYTDKTGTKRYSEDKSQSYRRFPFFIRINENDYDIGMNKGMFLGTREFEQYFLYKGFQGNMRKIQEKCRNRESLLRFTENMTIEPITGKYNELVEKLNQTPDESKTDEEILAEFISEGYGTQKE